MEGILVNHKGRQGINFLTSLYDLKGLTCMLSEYVFRKFFYCCLLVFV